VDPVGQTGSEGSSVRLKDETDVVSSPCVHGYHVSHCSIAWVPRTVPRGCHVPNC
jgi:hypothetical protein